MSQVPDTHQINNSETNTIQNPSELSEETTPTEQNTQSFTITNDSNLIQVPTHNITLSETQNHNQNNTFNTTQDKTSVLSTSNTTNTQPSQAQPSPRQTYDPPSIPSQFLTQTYSHNSPQQGSSNTQHTNTVQFQTQTPPSPPTIQTSTYTPAQNNTIQNIQTGLNLNTLHSNPPSNYTTSRHLSRPPLQTILTNPLSYNLTSTNTSYLQQPSTQTSQSQSLNIFPPQQMSNTIALTLQTSQFQLTQPPPNNVTTNPNFHTPHNNPLTNTSQVPTNNTVQTSTISSSPIPTNIYQFFHFNFRTYQTF